MKKAPARWLAVKYWRNGTVNFPMLCPEKANKFCART